jgi:putative MFS transporter
VTEAPSRDNLTGLDWRALKNAAIWAGALGYLVDIYDLNVDANFRQQLFQSFGIGPDKTVQTVTELSRWSSSGLLLGGFIWGILGDRLGRVLSLFGSIALYSVGVLAIAAFCHSLLFFKVAIFFVGLGLSGELGGSVTLVLESLPATMRTFGIMLIAAMGMLGVVIAGLLAEICSWRIGFAVGGVMGLALLTYRINVRESLLFQRMEVTTVSRGNWFRLLWPWPRLERYLASIFIGIAPLFVLFFYGAFSPEIGKELHLLGDLKINRAAVATFAGLGLGDLLVAWLSYRLKSRKRPILWFFALSAVAQTLIVTCRGVSPVVVYALMFVLGMATANALYVTTVAEQFGTNLRDTATTTVTNFIRFTRVPLTLLLTAWQGRFGLTHTGFLISLGTLALGILALSRLKETYGSDVEFVET